MAENEKVASTPLTPGEYLRSQKRGINRVYRFYKAHCDTGQEVTKANILEEIKKNKEDLLDAENRIAEDPTNKNNFKEAITCIFAIKRFNKCIENLPKSKPEACLSEIKIVRKKTETAIANEAIRKLKQSQ